MKATCIYRDNGQSVVRELPTMKEPTSHPFEDFTGDRQMADKNIDDWDRYNRHIASLKEYPASWVTKEMDGKDVECRLQWQRYNGHWTNDEWIDCTEADYNDSLPHGRRIIAVPVAEESEKQKKLIVEIMSQDEADGLYEQGDGKYYKIGNSRLPVEQGEKVTYSLKKIRNYFGEHDKTPFENWAFVYLDNMIRRGFAPVQPPVSVEEKKHEKTWEEFRDLFKSLTTKENPGIIDLEHFILGYQNGHAAALASGGQDAMMSKDANEYYEWLKLNGYRINEMDSDQRSKLYQLFLNNKTEVK